MTLHWLDHAVVLAYMAFAIGLGLFFRKQKSSEEFFNAGKSMGWLPVGLSVMATLFSTNSFVMYPSAAFGNSLRVGMVLIAFLLFAPVIIGVFIPIYARLGCRTAYEYLEMRFHVSVRCLASGLFILLRIAWMAAATYAAALALAAISGGNLHVIIYSLGVVAIGYTILGGLRAVMWTDVLQFFVFVVTILLAMGLLIMHTDGGVSGMMQHYFAGREDLVVDFSLSMTLKFGSSALLIGTFLEGLSAFGADQVAVQRYIAARDERTSQIGFVVTVLGNLIVTPGLLLIGVGLYGYYLDHPAELAPVLAGKAAEVQALHPNLQLVSPDDVQTYYLAHDGQIQEDVVKLNLSDQAFPRFVKMHFPIGVAGLMVVALMAAIMSSIDSGIHSVTTALMVDFRDRFAPHWKPKTAAGELWLTRGVVVVVGIISVVLANFVGSLGEVFSISKTVTAGFGGPLLAVFILGFFFRRVSATAVFAGTFAGAIGTLCVIVFQPDWFSLWFWPIGFGITVLLSLGLSVFFPVPTNVRHAVLTYWSILRRPVAPAGEARPIEQASDD